jgi:hypothetical protein
MAAQEPYEERQMLEERDSDARVIELYDRAFREAEKKQREKRD